MSKEREVLKLARDVLLPYKSTGLRWYTDVDEALDAIEEVLAQREQKPVGVVALDTSRPFVGGSYNGQAMPWSQAPTVKTVVMFKDLPLNTPLYTAPPQEQRSCDRRTWVGLTDEDIKAVNAQVSQIPPIDYTTTTYARAIETKLKEKNT